jgi:hypothetical protein
MSENDWMGFCNEAAYAGGISGAAYAENTILQASISQFPILHPSDASLPYLGYIRDNIRTIGDGAETVRLFLKDVKNLDSEMSFIPQQWCSGWYDMAVTGTVGCIPWPSFAMAYKIRGLNYNAFGCLVDEWSWEGKAGEISTFKLKPQFYDVQYKSAPSYTKVEYLSLDTYPGYRFSDCAFKVSGVRDGSITPYVTEASITVKNTFEDGRIAGWNGPKFYYQKKRDYEGKMTFYTSMTGLAIQQLVDEVHATNMNLQYNMGYFTLAITGAKAKEDGLNWYKYEDSSDGPIVYKYELQWDMGSGFIARKE